MRVLERGDRIRNPHAEGNVICAVKWVGRNRFKKFEVTLYCGTHFVFSKKHIKNVRRDRITKIDCLGCMAADPGAL